MTTKTSQTTIIAVSTLVAVAISMSITPAFAESEQNPWGSYYENPNSSSGDERAEANANESYVYARVPDNTQYTSNEAWVYQNLASDQTPGSTPAKTLTSGASKIYLDVEYAYDGNIQADAWAGTAELWKGAKLYKDGSFLQIYGVAIGGAGDKTSSSDTETFWHNHSGTATYKAAGYFEALSSTGFFTGEQIVDFWNNPHDVLIKDITLRT